ncbi:heterokaryon incompatibility protein-domain-containing protein [Aspergillus varians]
MSGGKGYEVFDHHRSIAVLNDSALEGCHLCSLLLSRLPAQLGLGRNRLLATEECIPSEQSDRSSYHLRLIHVHGLRRMHLKDWFYNQVSGHTSKWLYIDDSEVHPSEDTSTSGASATQERSLSTASQASFQLAIQWISCCRSNHKSCNPGTSQSPTRLLDVRNAETSRTVKLRLSTDIADGLDPRRIEYVALSHRWGKQQLLKLELGTIQQFMDSIEMNSLPLTFQHAVIATRYLGFDYLWIDSLCIIQDSPSDWEYESSIMGEIYKGSVVTLAALSAHDSHGGLFHNCNPLMTATLVLDDGTKIKPRSQWESVPLQGELLQRGWVVQERVLAPRTLFYTSWGIAWECAGKQLTEDGKVDFGETPKADFRRVGLQPGVAFASPVADASLLSFHSRWTKLLEIYSATRLTRPGDKLVAFHGIITDVASRAGLTSVAGLWKEIFIIELLWRTKDPQSNKTSPYRAPSWSWASLDTQVTNSWAELLTPLDNALSTVQWLPKAHVKDIQVEQKVNGELIDRAFLQINGPLKTVRLHGDAAKEGLLHQQREWACIFGYEEAMLEAHWGFHDGTVTRSKVFPDWKMNNRTNQLYVLWVAQVRGREARQYQGNTEPRIIDIGLVLEPDDLEHNVFRRKGYFEQYFYADISSRLFGPEGCYTEQCLIIV